MKEEEDTAGWVSHCSTLENHGWIRHLSLLCHLHLCAKIPTTKNWSKFNSIKYLPKGLRGGHLDCLGLLSFDCWRLFQRSFNQLQSLEYSSSINHIRITCCAVCHQAAENENCYIKRLEWYWSACVVFKGIACHFGKHISLLNMKLPTEHHDGKPSLSLDKSKHRFSNLTHLKVNMCISQNIKLLL